MCHSIEDLQHKRLDSYEIAPPPVVDVAEVKGLYVPKEMIL